MQILKSIFQFYIYSSIHVALAVVAFTIWRMKELQLDLDYCFLTCIFLASISGYNFVKYAGITKLYHRRLTKQLRSIQFFSANAFLFMLYFIFQLKIESILLLAGLSLINFMYAFPVFTNGKNLRNLVGIKVFIIALVWSLSSVLLPVLEFEVKINALICWQFAQQMLMLVALMIPFEIRDFNFDSQDLRTLPQMFGIWESKIIGIIILILSLIISIFNNEISVLFTCVFSFQLGCLILFAQKNQPKYYASFIVEAVPIVSLGFYLMINLFPFVY